jgi:DUF1680 family protein
MMITSADCIVVSYDIMRIESKPMRLLLFLVCAPALLAAGDPSAKVILNLEKSPQAKLHNVPVPVVTINDGFWAARRKTNVDKSIPTMLELLEEHGVVDNFRRLTGAKNVERKGPLYTDSDIYKWMESVAYVLQSENRPDLEATFDRLTDTIVAAQEPSGYLNTYFQDERKSRRFSEMDRGHELYCLGHMLQAAVAYYRATGKRKLMDAGIRYANYLLTDFGPDKRPLLAGHPEIEMALIELSRTTGDRRYAELAGYILHGERERLKLTPAQLTYMFSGRPFTERTIMEGHAVRAGYACSGATDYYLETGDPAYLKTLQTLWADMTTSKMYLTGGIGSRSAGEAFGDAYELPNAKAYTESCAAIANLMWNWRMLHATGEARYTDVLERALYNSANSGMSLTGTMYCYRNPLELSAATSEKIRNPWYSTTCCPPNLERLLAQLPGYFYSTSRDGLYVHLYDNNELAWKLEDRTALRAVQKTRYPWDGAVDLTLEPAAAKEFTLYLRIPGWSKATQISVNGKPASERAMPGTYLALKRQWKPGDTVHLAFDMRPHVIASNPLVEENYGRAAVQRGPLVYCMEQIDQSGATPLSETALKLSNDFVPEQRPDLLGGIVVLKHRGFAQARSFQQMPLYAALESIEPKPGKSIDLTFIPYYTFANREPTAMQVWTTYYK